jgi:hypothetical protein
LAELIGVLFVVVADDELLSDYFPYKEIQNGMLWEVNGKVHLSVCSRLAYQIVLLGC